MEKHKFIVLTISILLSTFIQAGEKKIFSTHWNENNLTKVLIDNWHPYPTCSERDKWEKMPDIFKETMIKEGEKYLGKPFAFLPSSEFLSFFRDGNRKRYEALSFGRRDQLSVLVMAECLEGKGRFMDDIVNGIWAICEETYWGIPGHVNAQKIQNTLPDITEPTIDLFAAETGSLLASTLYLLESQLNKISPLVVPRIILEENRRILEPYRTRNDFWWFGFNGGPVINWNPWINSNILLTTLLLEKNNTKKAEIIAKALRSLDTFIDNYPNDGGCDEGPGYWNRAGASLFDCMEVLSNASNGKIDLHDKPIIKNIAQFIYKAHIANSYYVNYADASPIVSPDGSMVYRFGKMIGDEKMKQFGAYIFSQNEQIPLGNFRNPFRILPFLSSYNEIKAIKPIAPLLKNVWLPDLQVVYVRDQEGTTNGFYFSAKGGHNAESHNHNDVGSFILYYDGNPVIVDAGVGNYTSKTFSNERYTIWSMQSQFHNLPTINGVMQKDGRQYQAQNVSYKTTNSTTDFSLNIANAYPEETAVNNWLRKYHFVYGKGLLITDIFDLNKFITPNRWNFITCLEVSILKSGVLILNSNEDFKTNRTIELHYPANLLSVEVETIKIAPDEGFSLWKGKLKRIIFTSRNRTLKGKVNFDFR